MDRIASRESDASEPALLSISEASALLGVSEVALRQWTDEGRVKAFVTPGGHRRYARREIQRLTRSQNPVQGIKDLVVQLEGVAEQERDIARTHFTAASWYATLSPESQAFLADNGRRLLDMVIKYASAPSRREDTAEQIRGLGHELGAELSRIGLSLIDTAEAFVMHRTPVVNAATNLLKNRKPVDKRTIEVMPLINQIMDEAFIALVSSYQQQRNGQSLPDAGGPR